MSAFLLTCRFLLDFYDKWHISTLSSAGRFTSCFLSEFFGQSFIFVVQIINPRWVNLQELDDPGLWCWLLSLSIQEAEEMQKWFSNKRPNISNWQHTWKSQTICSHSGSASAIICCCYFNHGNTIFKYTGYHFVCMFVVAKHSQNTQQSEDGTWDF